MKLRDGSTTEDQRLGRLVPPDFEHVEKYPFLAAVRAVTVERTLIEPSAWYPFYDQGAEGACVGFGCSRMMSLLNRQRYSARWLYLEAQKVDEWPGEGYEGTSVRAALDVLRDRGHRRYYAGAERPESSADGISVNRWATAVDEVRASIAAGVPCTIGVNWYSGFDEPIKSGVDWWVARQPEHLGHVRGGHCVVVAGASDRRQAVAFFNSWGTAYPRKVWMPYVVLERLIAEDGEVGLVTDR